MRKIMLRFYENLDNAIRELLKEKLIIPKTTVAELLRVVANKIKYYRTFV